MAAFLLSPLLGHRKDVHAHAFFTRKGGVSKGLYASLNMGRGSRDDPLSVLENRNRARMALGADALFTPYQVHGNAVWILDEGSDSEHPPEADAIVTATPGQAVGILSADCCPVLFADPEARVVGAAHAGWRGLMSGVLEAAISAMEGLGAVRARLLVATGPSIARKSYEVGPDMKDEILSVMPYLESHFQISNRPGHFLFDLPGAVGSALVRSGIVHLEGLERDCYQEEEFFYSYRRATHRGEPDYGRQLSAIMLRRP